MNSWVYIFSRFTPEALLFESLFICVLCAGYAAFWVLRKRKHGAVDTQIPATVVKGYLNELIVDATQLRAQLFGLLAAAGVPMDGGAGEAITRYAAAGATPSNAAPDPALAQKMAALEAKMAEQARAMEAALAEKLRLEKELLEARANAGEGGDTAALGQMQEKINGLEGKLAEYSVIEDDLANLKRLQQENTQLKATLAGKGGAVSAGVPTAAAVVAAAAAEPVSEPEVQADPFGENPVLESAPSSDAFGEAPSGGGDQFEGLVDQVEQSLQPTASPMGALDSPPETSSPASSNEGKSDADLVAEFEKMLSG